MVGHGQEKKEKPGSSCEVMMMRQMDEYVRTSTTSQGMQDFWAWFKNDFMPRSKSREEVKHVAVDKKILPMQMQQQLVMIDQLKAFIVDEKIEHRELQSLFGQNDFEQDKCLQNIICHDQSLEELAVAVEQIYTKICEPEQANCSPFYFQQDFHGVEACELNLLDRVREDLGKVQNLPFGMPHRLHDHPDVEPIGDSFSISDSKHWVKEELDRLQEAMEFARADYTKALIEYEGVKAQMDYVDEKHSQSPLQDNNQIQRAIELARIQTRNLLDGRLPALYEELSEAEKFQTIAEVYDKNYNNKEQIVQLQKNKLADLATQAIRIQSMQTALQQERQHLELIRNELVYADNELSEYADKHENRMGAYHLQLRRQQELKEHVVSMVQYKDDLLTRLACHAHVGGFNKENTAHYSLLDSIGEQQKERVELDDLLTQIHEEEDHYMLDLEDRLVCLKSICDQDPLQRNQDSDYSRSSIHKLIREAHKCKDYVESTLEILLNDFWSQEKIIEQSPSKKEERNLFVDFFVDKEKLQDRLKKLKLRYRNNQEVTRITQN